VSNFDSALGSTAVTAANKAMQDHFKSHHCGQSGRESLCPEASRLYGAYLAALYQAIEESKQAPQ
jgi:hypothetical protein